MTNPGAAASTSAIAAPPMSFTIPVVSRPRESVGRWPRKPAVLAAEHVVHEPEQPEPERGEEDQRSGRVEPRRIADLEAAERRAAGLHDEHRHHQVETARGDDDSGRGSSGARAPARGTCRGPRPARSAPRGTRRSIRSRRPPGVSLARSPLGTGMRQPRGGDRRGDGGLRARRRSRTRPPHPGRAPRAPASTRRDPARRSTSSIVETLALEQRRRCGSGRATRRGSSRRPMVDLADRGAARCALDQRRVRSQGERVGRDRALRAAEHERAGAGAREGRAR